MDSGVLAQRVRVREECATDAAYVRLLTSVDAHVLPARIGRREAHTTLITGILLLASVRPLVHMQVGHCCECLATFGALELLTVVHAPPVHLQRARVTVCYTTQFAPVRLFPGVHHLVSAQVTRLKKRLGADGARIWPDARMEAHVQPE